MISPSPPLTLASQPTELLLALVTTALPRRKTLIPGTAGNLLVAEVLEFALPLLTSHREGLRLACLTHDEGEERRDRKDGWQPQLMVFRVHPSAPQPPPPSSTLRRFGGERPL
jgi:hypothetical protein